MATWPGWAERPEPVPVSFSLEFESLNPMFDYRECVDKESERISQKVASEHLEQFGRATGTVTVAGKPFEISGLGERDHSWGVRDWNAPKMWIWLTAEFSESLAFNVTKLFVEEGEVSAGFVYLDGRNLPVVKADIDHRPGRGRDPPLAHHQAAGQVRRKAPGRPRRCCGRR